MPILARLSDNWRNEIDNVNGLGPRDSSSPDDHFGESQEEPGPSSYSQTTQENLLDSDEEAENGTWLRLR